MTAQLTVATASRRYVALTALRWFPLGISIPVTVLLASSRGLSAADIGVVFAVHSVVAFALVAAGRAVDSGPQEAWYVDAVHHHQPGADVTAGLARASVADGARLALGAPAPPF